MQHHPRTVAGRHPSPAPPEAPPPPLEPRPPRPRPPLPACHQNARSPGPRQGAEAIRSPDRISCFCCRDAARGSGVERHENCSGLRRVNFSKRHQNCSALLSVERYDNFGSLPRGATGREGSDVDGGSPGGPPVEGELLGFDVLLVTARPGEGCQQICPGVPAAVPGHGYERWQGRVDQLEASAPPGQLQAKRQVEGRDVVGPVPREEVPGAPGSQECPGVLGDSKAGPFGSEDRGGTTLTLGRATARS